MPETPDPAARTIRDGRCHACGYALSGLAETGTCPECGIPYDRESAHRLEPWPSAFEVCLRLGWPVMGLVIAGVLLTAPSFVMLSLPLGWAMIVAVAVNSYYQVRSMLRRSLPDAVRTKGPVAILRAIGTTLCVIILLAFVGGPLVLGITCLIMIAGSP
ncbi:MAG: hypothetical protein ACYTGR_15820 [Planctomycetota bacterium]|jgi:hypothetical protein